MFALIGIRRGAWVVSRSLLSMLVLLPESLFHPSKSGFLLQLASREVIRMPYRCLAWAWRRPRSRQDPEWVKGTSGTLHSPSSRMHKPKLFHDPNKKQERSESTKPFSSLLACTPRNKGVASPRGGWLLHTSSGSSIFPGLAGHAY